MAKYEPDDIVTYWFIIRKEENGDHEIQAFSDHKTLIKYYLDFHKCSNFVVKEVTDTAEKLGIMTEEARYDEIKIYNIKVRNPKKKKGEEFIEMCIPSTETEMSYVYEECNTFMASMVPYSTLNVVMPYLKGKYKRGLEKILLKDIIDVNVNRKDPSRLLTSVEFDQLMILFKSFSTSFGK